MVKNGWFCCPYCGRKLFPIKPDTKIQNLELKCKTCKHIIQVNI